MNKLPVYTANIIYIIWILESMYFYYLYNILSFTKPHKLQENQN